MSEKAARDALAKLMRTEEVREMRRGHRKPNGHQANCVCRTCFEEWLASEQERRDRLAKLL